MQNYDKCYVVYMSTLYIYSALVFLYKESWLYLVLYTRLQSYFLYTQISANKIFYLFTVSLYAAKNTHFFYEWKQQEMWNKMRSYSSSDDNNIFCIWLQYAFLYIDYIYMEVIIAILHNLRSVSQVDLVLRIRD